MGRWLRHRPGGAGLRSEHLSSTGAMGPSVSWDPWPRPVARVAVVTQECTQIGENGLSTPFRGTCVHCCAVADNRGYAGVYTDRRKRPLDAGLGRSCTLLRRDSSRRRPTRTPEEPPNSSRSGRQVSIRPVTCGYASTRGFRGVLSHPTRIRLFRSSPGHLPVRRRGSGI